jgi:DNA integrity scanning protein DisA with diadenylate cyclase activity
MNPIEQSIGVAATKIAKEIDADSIVSIERIKEEEYDEDDDLDIKVTIFKRVRPRTFKKIEYKTKIRKLHPGSIIPVKEILMEAITKDYIQKGEKIVCIEDGSMGTGYKGVLFIFDVDEIFFKIGKQQISEDISSEIVEAVLDIAMEIGHEGREGKNVGTAFIIGNLSELNKYLRQLIINPFGRLEEKIKITDPTIKETIKEFAQLDGMFIIDEEGNIISAGTYIDINFADIDLPQGFGTKHRTCAAVTKETSAISIVVSESGGKVRILKDGRIAVKI